MSTCTNSLQAEVHTLLLNMYTHTHTHTHIYMYVCMYTDIYIYVCVCVCVCNIYVYIYVCVCVCVSVYIYIHIYYYTPLPLNLANKQATTTTTRLRAVLAIAPSQRFGSFADVAILEPRWCPCQIQVLSQKLTGGGPGRWRHVGRCPPKSVQFWAKNSHFSPKTALVRVQNSQTKANGCYTPRAA